MLRVLGQIRDSLSLEARTSGNEDRVTAIRLSITDAGAAMASIGAIPKA